MSVDHKIGEKLRQIREARQLSTAQLAEQSHCEAALIDNIEGGRQAPGLAPLMKLSRALGVRLGTLLDDDSQEAPLVVKAGTSHGIIRFPGKSSEAGSNLDFYALGAGKHDRHMEPFLIDVQPPGPPDTTLSSHEGEEFIYVLEGSVRIKYGKSVYDLEAGESIYFDSVVPHEVHARDDGPARILAVLYTPF